MNAMFSDCNSLTNLNLSNFNTQKVLDMSYMFAHCNNLKKLNLKNFKIKENTDVSDIYYNINSDCVIISDEKKMIELKETES
jgi:surface protein